jgi:hypothetical protein
LHDRYVRIIDDATLKVITVDHQNWNGPYILHPVVLWNQGKKWPATQQFGKVKVKLSLGLIN